MLELAPNLLWLYVGDVKGRGVMGSWQQWRHLCDIAVRWTHQA